MLPSFVPGCDFARRSNRLRQIGHQLLLLLLFSGPIMLAHLWVSGDPVGLSSCPLSHRLAQAARIELAAQEAKTAAGATTVALPSPEKPALDSDGAGPWGIKQRSLFRSDSAARLAAQQGSRLFWIEAHDPRSSCK